MLDPLDATIDLTVIRDLLSPARLRRYEDAAAGDLIGAIDLYRWNTDASAAFFAVLQGVEVILRNAMSEQMEALHHRRGYGGTWFDDPFSLLDERRLADIDDARLRLRQDGHPPTQDRLITMVPFGFWRQLLSGRYERTLWTPALHKAFPYAPVGRRRYIASRVERLHHLRNRIAHHEPIFPRRLDRDMEEALDITAAIEPTSATWLELYSWAPGLLIGGIPTQRHGTV